MIYKNEALASRFLIDYLLTEKHPFLNGHIYKGKNLKSYDLKTIYHKLFLNFDIKDEMNFHNGFEKYCEDKILTGILRYKKYLPMTSLNIDYNFKEDNKKYSLMKFLSDTYNIYGLLKIEAEVHKLAINEGEA